MKKLYRFGDNTTPAFIKSSLHHCIVCPRRTRPDNKWVRHFQTVNSNTEIGLHRLTPRGHNSEPNSSPTKIHPTHPREFSTRVTIKSNSDSLSQSKRCHSWEKKKKSVCDREKDENEYLGIWVWENKKLYLNSCWLELSSCSLGEKKNQRARETRGIRIVFLFNNRDQDSQVTFFLLMKIENWSWRWSVEGLLFVDFRWKKEKELVSNWVGEFI